MLGQIFSGLSYLAWWSGNLYKAKRSRLISDQVSRVFSILSYIAFGVFDGLASTLYGASTGVVAMRKHPEKYFKLMVIVLVLLCLCNWSGMRTLVIFLVDFIDLYAVIYTKDAQKLRGYYFISEVLWCVFQIMIHNWVGVPCQVICFSITGISYIYYYKKEQLSKETVKSI